MRLLLLPPILLALALPAIAQGSGEERRYFRDWLAACRADGYCSATAYENPNPGNGTVADYILRVGRHAEQTYWEISFSTVATMGDAARPFDVAVDGAAESFEGADEVAAYGSINDFFFMGAKAQAVMDRLPPGARIDIAFEDTDGNAQTAGFSLAGLTAALIWIDETQGRLGAERVAEAPPAGLEPAAPMPGSSNAIPAALSAQHAADTECQPAADLANGSDSAVVTLDDSASLYILPCWRAAYNGGWKAYVGRFDAYASVAVPEFSPSDGWTATSHLVNYAWDDAATRLSSFNKWSGIGDCGTAGIWEWSGYNFRLVESRAKEDCDGEGGVDDFPVVYPLDGQ